MKWFVIYFEFLLVAFPFFLNGQSQNIWYFGNMAGLDFNKNPPLSIGSGLFAQEGTATTCSNEGELLFYTNGATIWDRQHQVMPNGMGLSGGASSAQAALIVPLPGSCHIYYLFTTEDHLTDGGLAYSIIDMCLNNGFGDVVSSQKNILLENQTTEQLTAIRHVNGEDVWILTHKLGSDEFLVYLLTASGLNTTPVKSSIGSTYPTDAIIGQIKASHNSDKIVSNASFRNIYEMFDFNNSTGKITNHLNLRSIIGSNRFVYGIEFSPNDSLLYLSTFYVSSDLIQLDLQSLQPFNLQTIPGHYKLGSLQLGPNNKIYLAQKDQPYLGVIHSPDVPGIGCNYDPSGQSLLSGTTSQLGFPNIIPYTLMPNLQAPDLLLRDTSICAGDTIEISLSASTLCNASFLWEDGSTSQKKKISTPGLYHVELMSSCGNAKDSIMVSLKPEPFVSIPDDTLCIGDALMPENEVIGVHYLWSDHTSNNFFQASSSGTYWLQVSNECSSYTDSFNLVVPPVPKVEFSDSTICKGDTIPLKIPVANEGILWSDGEMDDVFEITEGGQFWVRISYTCGHDLDTFTFIQNEKPIVHLTDTLICYGRSILLNAYYPESSYAWSDHSDNSSLAVSEPGLYSVVVSNVCGSDSSSMTLVNKNCDFNVVVPNVFSPNGDGINDFIQPAISQVVSFYEFQIFDRWGNNVFSSNDSTESWDGRFREKECAAAVYTMTITCISTDGIEKRLKGDITLLR